MHKMSVKDIGSGQAQMQGITGDDVAKRLSSSLTKVLITGDLTVIPEAAFDKIFNKPYKFDEMEEFTQGYLKAKYST